MKKPDTVYYICSKNNLHSILKNGIFCRSKINRQFIEHDDIHDPEVLNRRTEVCIDPSSPVTTNLADYVNLYFQPRNAMLFRLKSNGEKVSFVILGINSSVVGITGSMTSDRNAAASDAQFSAEPTEMFKNINRKTLDQIYWTPETKQKMMAELLIPEEIPPSHIMTIFVGDEKTVKEVSDLTRDININISVVAHPDMFFKPTYTQRLGNNISLVQGDMFFSNMQVFTISVNTKGIMGKGLASRTKYQFPDAYVQYQDHCKSKKLRIGKPTLFKRAIKIEEQMADDVRQLNEEKLNDERWFLFFPTKDHWREDSKIEYIEESMNWLAHNYKKEGIKSIALPALGCGLGQLSWKDVGPIMCRYLKQMEITSCIYLPVKKMPEEKFLTPEYLL